MITQPRVCSKGKNPIANESFYEVCADDSRKFTLADKNSSDSGLDGIKLSVRNQEVELNFFGQCWIVKDGRSSTEADALFIPAKTKEEWMSFVDSMRSDPNSPVQIVRTCNPPQSLTFSFPEIAADNRSALGYWITGYVDVTLRQNQDVLVEYRAVPSSPYQNSFTMNVPANPTADGKKLSLCFTCTSLGDKWMNHFSRVGIAPEYNMIFAPFYLMEYPDATGLKIGQGLLPSSYTIPGVTSIDKTFCEKFITAYAMLRRFNPKLNWDAWWDKKTYFNDIVTPHSFGSDACSDW